MILYNVTVSVEENVETEWLEWMREVHIPEMLKTGCFKEHKILKLLSEQPIEEGVTYAIQYFAEDSNMIDQYLNYHAPILRKAHSDRFGNTTAAFRTLLEVL